MLPAQTLTYDAFIKYLKISERPLQFISFCFHILCNFLQSLISLFVCVSDAQERWTVHGTLSFTTGSGATAVSASVCP